MSQAKVDQYKKEKTHRKQSMRREKLERALAWIIVAVIAAAICIWIGFSIYSKANIIFVIFPVISLISF